MKYRDDEPQYEILPPAPMNNWGPRAGVFSSREDRHATLVRNIQTAVQSVHPSIGRGYDPLVEMAILATDPYADIAPGQRFGMHATIAKYIHPELKAQDIDELPGHKKAVVVETARHELAAKYENTLPPTNEDGTSSQIVNPERRAQMNALMNRIAENMAKKDPE